MIINAEKRFLAIVLAVLMMFSVLPVTSFAASTRMETGTLGGIAWTAVVPVNDEETADFGSVSVDGNTITLTAQAEASEEESCNDTSNEVSYGYTQTCTELTLTNNLSVAAVISFSFSPTGTIEIDGTQYVSSSEFESDTLAPGGFVTVLLASPKSGKEDVGDISSVVLSGISIIENITRDMVFAPVANGTIKVEDTTVFSNITQSVAYANGINVAATPQSGYKFLAWMDQNNTVLSTEQSTNLKPVRDDMIVSAKFVPATETGHWLAGGKIWTDLDEALNAAASGDKTVKLMDNTTLKKSYTIPAGITVSVPFNQALTTYGPNPEVLPSPSAGAPEVKLYCTLTLDKDVTLSVYGSLEVSTNHLAAHGGKIEGGRPYEYYSMIQMGDNSHIDIQSGGRLYAWGYIVGADSAKVTAASGATVYEKMQITDYRDGDITSIIAPAGVFPFNQYYVQNVEVAEVLHSGATLVCHAGFYLAEVTTDSIIFIGGTDAMFGIGAGATVVKKYDNANDRLLIDINGNASMNPITLKNLIANKDLNTSEFIFPVNHNITVNVNSGIFMMNQDILMQPGAEVNVGREAYVQFASEKKVYLMDTQDWGDYCFGAKLKPVSYVPLKNAAPNIRTEADMTDAKINIDGVAVVVGQMYSSTNGALIESSGKTGVVVLMNNAPGSTTNIKQSPMTSAENLSTATTAISVGAASLTNADGTAVSTEDAGQYTTYVYDSILDQWVTTDITITPTLTFDANGGFMDSAKTSTTETVSVDYQNTALAGQPLSLAVTGIVPVRDGYTFAKKWNTAADGSGKDFARTDYLTISQEHTLYAVWEQNVPATYAITWSVNGTPVTMEVEADTVPVYPDGTPAKTSDQQKHYTFSGWATTENGTVLENLPVATDNAIYYAVFTETAHTYATSSSAGKHKCTGCDYAASCGDTANDKDHLCDLGCGSVMDECVPGIAKEEKRVEATCDNAGSYDTVVYCTVCNKELSRTTTEIKKLGHDMKESAAKVEPTCEAAGKTAVYTCANNCGKTEGGEEIAALGHKWGAWNVITAATCTTAGEDRRDCTVCDAYETVVTNALNHLEVSHEAKAPTCTEPGWDAYVTCSRCDYTTKVEKAALGHTEETIPAVDATCTETGLTAGVKCSVCGKILTEQTVVDALGHTEETIPAVDATCTETGLTAGVKCSVCGEIITAQKVVDALGHNYVGVETKAPTCTEAGVMTYTCSNDADHTYTEEIPMIEHDWAEADCTKPSTCKSCGAESGTAIGHSYTRVVKTVAKTCTTDGYTVYGCVRCDATETRDIVAASHTLTSVDAQPATCEDKGWDAYEYCSECDYTTYKEITALGHDMQKTADQIDATCETAGTEAVYTCANNCGKTEGGAEIAALGHDMKESAAKVEPTCETAGKTAVLTCANGCGKTEGGEEIAALGHNMQKTADQIDAACEVAGKTAVYTCANGCGKTEGGEEIAATGHDMQKTADQIDATCEAAGKTAVLTCANGCGKTEGGEEIAATGHDMQRTADQIDATCEAAGKTAVYTCANGCGKTEGGEEITALGHDYVGVETKAPTCTETGVMTYTCSNDANHTYNEEIPMIEHDWAEADCTKPSTCLTCGAESGSAIGHSYTRVVKTVAKTCTTDGYTVYGCVRCDATETRDIVAASHTLTSVDAKTATCEEIGWDAYEYCSECDYTTYKEIAALGHDMKETADQIDATCEATGKTAVLTCANNCGKTEGGEEIAALGHDMKETAAKVDATCEVAGKTAVLTCANGCGKTEGGAEIAALGHDMKETAAKVEATCEVAGKTAVYTCANNCGKTEGGEEIAALGHDMKETAAKVDATCEVAGKTAVYTCANGCGKTEGGEEIAALGHDMQKTADQIDATCEAAGKTAVYTCANNCGKTEGGEEIAALGHDMKETAAKVDATCEAAGKTAVYTCANGCGKTEGGEEIKATGHDYVGVETKAPTCTETGVMTYTCSNDADHTYTEEIPMIEHDWAEADCTKPSTCLTCGAESGSAIGHSYTRVVKTVAKTCTTDGYTVYGCVRCDATETRDIVAASHTLTSVAAQPATCENIGWNAYEYCSACDYTTYAEIPATDHDYVGVVTTEPTCLTAGVKTFTCQNDKNHTYTEEVAALGHNEVAHDAKAPTCTETGWDAYVTCSRCDYTTKVAKAALGHKWTAATCTAAKTCSVCKTTDGAALGHNYTSKVTKAATCTAAGIKTFTCSVCDDIYTEEILSLGHTPGADATCTDDQVCTVCDEVLTEKLGHAEEVIPGKTAICTATGLTEGKKCSVCGEVLVAQAVIDKTSHKPTMVGEKAATETQDGYTGDTVCATCGMMIEEGKIIPATGDSSGSGRCDHLCHKDGIPGFFWKILRLFFKLFQINPVCECGAAHY